VASGLPITFFDVLAQLSARRASPMSELAGAVLLS
jgi:hypothetical protein